MAHEYIDSDLPKHSGSGAVSSVGLVEKRAVATHFDRKIDSKPDNPASRITAAESKERLRQMQQAVKQANAQTPPRSNTGSFRKACSADILFLIDTTSSMQKYIDATRDQVKNIVRDIKETFLNETEVRISVVGYKDHDMGNQSIQFLDFTPSTETVSSVLDSLSAVGGADAPEDVLGGIRQAINASWNLQTRCIIHIADAPAHGGILHDFSKASDSYHEHGSEPHGLTYTPLLRKLVQLRINYGLLRVNSYTDRMALKFSEIYAAGGADVKLLRSNKYYSQSVGSNIKASSNLWSGSSTKNNAELQFEELPLGTSFRMLQQLVVRTVTRSASLAATRVMSAVSRESKINIGGDKKEPSPKHLTMINEVEETLREFALEEVEPQWTVPTWFKQKLTLGGFCPEISLHSSSTLNDMMASDDNIKLSVTQLAVHKRPKPFAAGAMRLAFYARTASSTNKFVVKSFKQEEENAMAQMIEDMRAQVLCKAFALEFNSFLRADYTVDFIVATGWQDKSKGATPNSYISIEPFIEGEYVKYNNNAGHVREDSSDPFNAAAQAFSHFTFERSFGYFMVTDLQGVGHSLTDPAIQAKDPERFKLSPTNHGVDGFKFFFATHECNSVCRKLELKSDKTMFLEDSWEFREEWPTMDSTVCCSNKLCRKILHLIKAQKSPKFPGCYWCDSCWPQLQANTTEWHCNEPGPDHIFEVSLFFYESQGQVAPHKCPLHLEKDTTAFTVASAGASLFSRMNSTSHKSTSGRAW